MKCKNLLELTESEAITMLESDPSVIKNFEDSNIVVKKGRFNRGDYITDGKINVSIPKGKDSKDITRDEAQELLNKKVNA